MKLAGSISAVIVIGLGLVACSGPGTGTQVIPTKKIALLLPSSAETKDQPIFEAKVQTLCSSCQVMYSNANQDAAAQRTQADAALSGGASVLVLDPVDGASAAAIVSRAAARHVPVIAYDTRVPGSDYYVSFDNEATGALQTMALLQALKGKVKPTIVMINGTPPMAARSCSSLARTACWTARSPSRRSTTPRRGARTGPRLR